MTKNYLKFFIASVFSWLFYAGNSQTVISEDFSVCSLPSGWTQVSQSSDTWSFCGSVDFGSTSTINDPFGNSGSYARIDFSNDPDSTALQTPKVYVGGLTTPELSFWYNSQTTSTSFTPKNQFYVQYWNGSSWVVMHQDSVVSGWKKYTFTLSSSLGTFASGDSVQLRFGAHEGGANMGGTGTATYDQDMALDHILLRETPTCFPPTSVRDTNLMATSNTILFNRVGSSNIVLMYEYGLSNFTQGSGTSGLTNSNSVSLSSLTAATGYDIYFRDVCSAGDTSAWVKHSFTTLYATPLKNNFTGFTGSNLSSVFPGWKESRNVIPSGTTSSWIASNSTQTTAFGKTTAKINLYTTSRDEWLISPRFRVTSTDSLVFKAAVTNYNSAGVDSMGSDDSVMVRISNDNGATWTNARVFTKANALTNSLTEYKVSLNAYNGQAIQVAFYAQDGPINDPEDYDFHITDIFIGTPPSNDLGVTAITEPSGGCGDDSTQVKVAVFNYGSATQSSIGVSVDVTGSATTTLSTTITSLASGKADTVVVGTLNTLAGGTYNFKGYTTHSGDQDNTNDTSMANGVKIGAVPTAPTVPSSAAVCSGDDTVIVATGSTSGYRWYNAASPGTVIHTGDSLKLTNATATATYLVEGYNFTSQVFGPTTAPTSSYINTNAGRGTGFNVNVPEVIIDSVTIYPTGTGWIIMKVSDYAGTTIYHTADTVFITGTNNLTKTRIPVNLKVPYGVGKYKMVMEYNGITGMGRNSQSYPFNSSGNEMSIIGGATGSGNPTSSNNYWFYDWRITVPGCPSERDSVKVTVKPLPVFSLGKDTAFCGASSINYTLDATTSGATYKWNDNSTNATLNVTASGTYSCRVTINGCFADDTVMVGANPLPTVNFPNPNNICSNDTATTLTGATPTGGVYSGTNVSGGKFNPVSAGAGQDTLYYTYTDTIGCMATDTAYITVDAAPNVTFTSLSDVCIGSSPFNLTGGMPVGGTYTGSGVNSSGVFTADTAGVGTHSITYSFTDTQGCTDTASQNQVVNALPTVSFSTQNNWCLNAAPINLTTGTPTGGSYTINGVVDTVYSATKAGVDTIVYTFTDSNSCTNTDTAMITADTVPVVTFATLSDLCVGSASYTLVEGMPMGGTYSGNSVTSGRYNPSTVTTDTLTYVFVDANNCSDKATQTITVNALPVVAISNQADVCENTPVFALSGGTPAGGTYSGGGVSGGNYDASSFGFGTDNIKYVYTDGNNCKDSATTTLVVNAVTKATLKFLGYSCDNHAAVSLANSGLPTGGVFGGTGVSGTDFDPTAAGAGTHSISYIYTNSDNCQDSTKGDIIVEASPVFNIVGDSVGCGDEPYAPVVKVNLSGMTYHWSNGSNADSAVIKQNGKAWVKVTDPGTQKLCFNHDTVNITYEEVCVGIAEPLAGTSVKYYPNPNNGTFNYEIEGFKGLDIDVKIITASGQEVYREVWNDVSDKSGEIQLDVMESGLYFIHLSTTNGSVIHRLEIMR